jgi:hypothetical protein
MDGELYLVALADMQRTPDLLRQRQLRFGPYLYPGADKRLPFDFGGRHAHGSLPSNSDFPTLLLYQAGR